METILERLRSHPLLTGGIAALIICFFLLVWMQSGRDVNGRVVRPSIYYADDSTLELVARPQDYAPLKEGDRTLVHATVIRGANGQPEIAYLTKLPDELVDQIRSNPASATPVPLVRLPKAGSTWVSMDSIEGQRIMARATAPNRDGTLPEILGP